MTTESFFLHSHRPVLAGMAYFAVVFGVAFCFGAIRVTLLVPRVGELVAVLIELPLILSVSWISLGWSVRKFDIPPRFIDRIVMGAVAFLLLMVAELTLSVVAFDKTASDFVQERVSSTSHLIGLMGQVLFGLFPIIEGRIHRSLRVTTKDE